MPPYDHLQFVLGNAYRLERELGGGGMSRVFVATEVRLGRKVVMKFVSEELAGSVSIERFHREIRTVALLQHPHIVPVLAAGDAQGTPYYTMPFVEGESLRARLDRDGPVSVERALSILRDIASALEYAHGKGVVHRDIKPDNVLLTGTAAVVTDFGIAKALQHAATDDHPGTTLTQAGMAIGTPEYMAPEQALGEPDVDHRADLYAFGCLAYELLTGKSPFAGRTQMKLIAAHLTEVPVSVASARADIPRSLAAIVMQCLEKDSASRPGSAAVVVSALERATADRLVMATQKTEERRAIAVLPFRNLSPDADVDYFADGLTEEIIADLSSVRALTVISRSSAMRFRAGSRDLRAVARELDVRYLLEGSLRRAGNTLRITAQLVDTTADANLWSERFDGTLDDVFAIQERIARSIVSALRVRLSPEEEIGIMDRPIRDLKAHEYYLRARQAIWTFTRDGNERAIALLGRGLEVEGDNALLFGTLGMAHSFLASFGVDSVENGARAVQYAEAAFALDADSPSGHTVMGMVALVAGDLSASAKSLGRVLAQEPSNVDVMLVLANVYLCAGRTEKAGPLLARCSELDPLLPLAHLMLGYLELMRGRYDLAARHYEKDFELVESPLPMSIWGYEMALVAAGRADDAFAIVDRLEAGAEADPHARMALMMRHALRGEHEEMMTLLTPEFRAMAQTQGYLARDIAAYHALVGRTADALVWLEHAVRGGFYNYPYFLRYRFYDSLRDEPRFRELMGMAKAKWEAFDG